MIMRRARIAGLVALTASLALAGCNKKEEKQPAAAAPKAYKVYASNEMAGTITVIDGPGRKVVATIPVGKRPRAIAVSVDGKYLYVTLSGSPIAGPGVDEKTLPPPDRSADGIAVVDTSQNKLVRVLTGVVNPEQVAVSSDGKLYAGSEDSQAVEVISRDGAKVASIAVKGEPEGVALRPDGQVLYVTEEEDGKVLVVDTATNAVIQTIAVGARPRSLAFSPDGARAYVTAELGKSLSILDAKRHTLLTTVRLTGEVVLPMGVAVSPDGKRVYVTTGRGGNLVVLDTESMRPLQTTAVGRRPWGVAISPDGKTVFTANGPSNDVTVTDAMTLQVIAKIPAGERPWGIAAR
jgi:YVTN family beta-propeller protein